MSGSGLMAGLVRLVLLALSGVFVVSLVVAGLFALVLTIIWSLLRGRKPAVFQLYTQLRDTSRRFSAGGGGFPSQTPTAASDVVDVDAREVDSTSRLK